MTRCRAFLALVATAHCCFGETTISLRSEAADTGNIGHGGTSVSSAMKELHRQALEDVSRQLATPPDSCSNWRNTTSDQNCAAADQCGKGWLFQSQGLLLAVQWGQPRTSVDDADTGDDVKVGNAGHATDDLDIRGGEWYAGESRTVTVVGLKAEGGGEESDCNSQDLSILLRLQGPEALAEASIPVTGRCAWTVEFRPSVGGVYTFDATLMLWKGGLDPHREMCNQVVGEYPKGSVELDYVRDVVFYGLSEACCALCTRSEKCVGWSSTVSPSVTLDGKKCVLYSSVSGPPVEDEAHQGAIRSGTRRDEEAPIYLGVSMSIPRRWCAPENASLMGSGGQFTVKATPSTSRLAGRREEQEHQERGWENSDGGDDLPLCRPTNVLPQAGRWMGLGDIGCDIGDQERSPGDPFWPVYNAQVFGVTKAEECFLQPMKGTVAFPSDSNGYALAIAEGYVWQPHSCRYSLLNADQRRSCFEAKNITRFLDYGDSLIQTSRQPRVELWIPDSKVDDNAKVTTDAVKTRGQESGCARGFFLDDADDTRMSDAGGDLNIRNRYCGLSGFHTSPASEIVHHITAFQPDVVVANWGLVHRMWHHSFEHEIGDFFEELGEALDRMAEDQEFRPRFMFWLSCPFLASEREPHCVLERGIQFNDGLRAVLEPRGWIEVDWAAMTRKWSIDIADGMHHGKHATRMLAHLLTYHICHDSDTDGGQ